MYRDKGTVEKHENRQHGVGSAFHIAVKLYASTTSIVYALAGSTRQVFY